RSQDVQPMRRLALHPGVPGGGDVCEPRRCGAGGSEVLPGMRILRAGLPLWLPVSSPREESRGQVHALLPQDYEGPHDRLLRSLPDRRTPARGLEESQGPDSCISQNTQRAGVEAADGHRRQGLLQRFGWFGAVRQLLAASCEVEKTSWKLAAGTSRSSEI